jgi:hypothetical protein
MRYWKTLKTIENLAEKPDLTLRTCPNVTKLFLGCDQIFVKISRIFESIIFF